MTQTSFNSLYYSIMRNIKDAENQISKLERERKKAVPIRRSRIDEKLHALIVSELPRLKKMAFNLRKNNYSLFLCLE